MALYFPIKLAWRLMRTASHERTISLMVKLCFWGIFISSFALALVAAITRGFEIVMHQNIKGIQSDLMIRSSQNLHYPKIQAIIQKEFHESIEAISPSSTYHALIDLPNSQPDISTIAIITSLDPESAVKVGALPSVIIQPKGATLAELLKDNQLLIGQDLANHLHLKVGDRFELLYPTEEQKSKNKLMLDATAARVGGIFATGIEELDMNGIFASHAFAEETFHDAHITQINIKVKPGVDLHHLKQQLAQRFFLKVISWQELYPAIMAALTLEKYGMMLILSLIVLVASMNTVSLLFMFISHKKRTLSLLYAYGMSPQAVRTTCMLVGLMISCMAALLGLLAAFGASTLLEQYRFISLPAIYYVSYLPAHMDLPIVLMVSTLIIATSLFTSWYPAHQIDRKQIAHMLKFER